MTFIFPIVEVSKEEVGKRVEGRMELRRIKLEWKQFCER